MTRVRAAVAVAALLAIVMVISRDAGPKPWSVLLIVSEPSPGAYLNPEGPAPPTPRLSRLAGAGVRLPLERPERSAGEWLGAVLGGPPPARSLHRALATRGWVTVGTARPPVSAELAGAFDGFAPEQPARPAVDAVLEMLGERVPRDADRALVVALFQTATPQELDRAAGRLIDGVAPWLPPAQTLVVIVDRGNRSAVLVAPERPELQVDGALGPEDLAATIARWLSLPLD